MSYLRLGKKFINTAAGLDAHVTKVGHELESCTSEIQSIPVRHPTQDVNIVFVDTPGFSNTYREDAEIMAVFAKWLKRLHESGTKLTGIVYMHDISHADIFEASRKCLDKLCGDEAIMNVTLATTKWRLADGKGDERENRLKERCWKKMLEHGATIARFEGTKDSAWTIVDEIIKKVPIDVDGIEGSVKESMTHPTLQNAEKGKKSDIIIALMGPTGSGKSSFINTAAGLDADVTKVGHDLESCTSDVLPITVRHPTQDVNIVFVDTPGFNDTFLDDSEILVVLANWLKRSYEKGTKLTGIIYVHDISQHRMFWASRKSLEMFGKLCGGVAIMNVTLATTKWRLADGNGDKREQRLKEKFWKTMLVHGATVTRFEDTRDSAWTIVDQIIDKVPINALLIQEELVHLQRNLPETSAAKTLRITLAEVAKRLQDDFDGDEDAARQLQSVHAQLAELKIPLSRKLAIFFTLKKARARPLDLVQ